VDGGWDQTFPEEPNSTKSSAIREDATVRSKALGHLMKQFPEGLIYLSFLLPEVDIRHEQLVLLENFAVS
jgi:hypothetical protein